MSITAWVGVIAGTVVGSGALAAVIYALYAMRSLAVLTASQATTIGVKNDQLDEARRNSVAYQQQRDIATQRADKAEAERDSALHILKDTQDALNKAQQENAENAAAQVKNAPDPLAELNRQLSSSARSDVPAAGDPGAGNGHQG